MKQLNYLLLCFLLLFTIEASGKTYLTITNLRTDYLTNPIGISSKVPLLSWEAQSSERNVMQTAYQIRAAYHDKELQTGKNLVWDTKKVASDKSLQIEYVGDPLELGKRIYWQVKIWDNKGRSSQWSSPSYFEPGFMKTEDIKAQFITPDMTENPAISNPSPMLRKEFSLKGKIQRARMYATSHGLFKVRLNGKPISDEMFAPGWTSYNKRLQYRVYDVTSLLQNGENAIGVMLGDGWYRGNLAWKKKIYGDQLAAYIQMEVTYADGSKELICTDNTWKATTGAIRMSDIYNGETYDARMEKTGWDKAGYNDSDWKGSKIKAVDKKVIVASESQPMRVMQTLKPIQKIQTPKGEVVFDMGKNMVGFIHFKLKGKAGSRIKLNFAEVLDKDGNFYTANLREAKCEDVYWFKGDGVEEYEPNFTFHGFRYVKISDYEGTVSLDDLTGKIIYTAFTETGSFNCSDTLINKLQENIIWGLRGNFLDVPTDCPQRDERLGWTGDAQVFAPTACFLEGVEPFFSKWLKDLAIDQLEDGGVPHVIPDMYIGSSSAGWADAATVIPMALYESYGDKRVIETQYPSMKKWVEYLRNKSGNTYLGKFGNHFGDWLAYATTNSDYPGATTDKDLISTAFFAHSVKLTEKAARILEKNDEADDYSRLFLQIKKAFIQEYMTPSGRLSSNTQTAYVLALRFDLVPEELIANVAKRLADDVTKFGHLTTGFLGTYIINEVLSDFGYHDEACMLLFRKKYPSWLYPVTMGATTIWERWDGIRTDGSFQDTGMNSFNHYAYGAVGNWLYTRVAGIKPLTEGYKKISIYPMFADSLTYVKADFHSVYGAIASHIERAAKQTTYRIVVPANTTAEIKLPGKADKISENGKPISGIKDLKLISSDNHFTVIETGSGDYVFQVIK